MSRYKTKNEQDIGMCTLPLILPMHRSLNRVIDSDSPWVSTDPVLWRECLALYRSVRLILLALIAFVSGPRRIQAEEASSESQRQVATAHLQTGEIGNSSLSGQSSALHETVQARRDNFKSTISDTLTDTNVNCGAQALALDSPKPQSLSRAATRAHAPPFSLFLIGFDALKLDRTIRLLRSAAHRATTLHPPIHQAQFSAQLIARPPSIRNGPVVAVILYLPKRKFLYLEVIRAHSPPSELPRIDSNTFPFESLNAINASADLNLVVTLQSISVPDSALESPTKLTSPNLAITIFQTADSYHSCALESLRHNCPISCHGEFPEGASFQAMSLLVSTQPNQLKGGYLYVS
jgi:hypothetical protein